MSAAGDIERVYQRVSQGTLDPRRGIGALVHLSREDAWYSVEMALRVAVLPSPAVSDQRLSLALGAFGLTRRVVRDCLQVCHELSSKIMDVARFGGAQELAGRLHAEQAENVRRLLADCLTDAIEPLLQLFPDQLTEVVEDIAASLSSAPKQFQGCSTVLRSACAEADLPFWVLRQRVEFSLNARSLEREMGRLVRCAGRRSIPRETSDRVLYEVAAAVHGRVLLTTKDQLKRLCQIAAEIGLEPIQDVVAAITSDQATTADAPASIADELLRRVSTAERDSEIVTPIRR